MGRSKKEIIDIIDTIDLNLGGNIFEYHGIKKYPPPSFEDQEKLPIVMLREALTWLDNIYSEVFIPWRRLWNIHPRNVWKRFKFSDTSNRETELLRLAADKFRKAYRANSRPDFFKKVKVTRALRKLNKKKKK
jgi:hypothetical protein